MGQSNQSTLSDQKQLKKIFTVQGRVKDQNLTYLQHRQTDKQYLLREAVFNQETQELEMLTKLKERQGFSNPHLTNLIKFEHQKKEDLCSKYYRVHSLWEYPRRNLAEQINERALVKQPFPPGQIKMLIRQICEGMLTLQKQRITHESLTSKTVLVQGPTHFRVVDPVAIPMHNNLQVLYHKRSLKNIYLSPQQCQIIEQQDLTKYVSDPYRSDIFTAGMLILESGLLQRQDDCYEDDCSKINWRQIEININKFGDIYGGELKGYVDMMLAKDISHRIHWDQLIEQIDCQRRQSFGRVGARVDTEPVQKTEETIMRSFCTPMQSSPRAIRNAPPISVQSRPPVVSFKPVPHKIVEEPTVIRQTQPQFKAPIQLQPPSQYQSQLRPQSFSNGTRQAPQIYNPQPLPQQRHEIVIHPPTNRNTVQTSAVYHYPPPQHTVPLITKEIISQPKELSTNIKSHNEEQPKTSEVKRTQFSPPPQITQPPQQIIEFDQNEPIYSIDQFKNGSKYEGYKFKGKRQGWGKYTYQEGGSYDGQWKNDLMCGRGKLYYQSGKLAYQGYLENDLFHGAGTLYNQQPEELKKPFDYTNFEDIDQFWISYEGQFRHDKKEGHGKLMLSNNEMLQGSFHEDKVEGEGVFTTMRGEKVQGIWHENRFQRQI